MQHVFRTGSAVGSARTTRTDLLLESLALRNQLGVLARSIRRFRPADRLLWLFLRWLWPRWREALVLVQPATVDRWHRDGLARCWRHRSRRPGRPRIDPACQDLIRRMAAENGLYVKPEIMWRSGPSSPHVVEVRWGSRATAAGYSTEGFAAYRSSSHWTISSRACQGLSPDGGATGGAQRSSASRFIAISISMYRLASRYGAAATVGHEGGEIRQG